MGKVHLPDIPRIPRPASAINRRGIADTTAARFLLDLSPCHRQEADAGNGIERAVRPEPIGHDGAEQQQPQRDGERRRPTAGSVEDPAEHDPADGTMGDVELLCGARKAAKPGGGFEGFDRI